MKTKITLIMLIGLNTQVVVADVMSVQPDILLLVLVEG
jgi:hypothetical protein